jgi:uncharacterized protein (TIGR02302 family)
MIVEVKPTQRRTMWNARLQRICYVAALSWLIASSLTTRPVFADELDEFLNRAEQSMRESADSLRSKNADKSVRDQSSAIRNLEQYLSSDQDRSLGDLQQDQQGLRDRLKKLQDELARRGMGPGQRGMQGQDGDQQQGDGEDEFGEADSAMGDATGRLGEGNADGAVDSQGRALEALRKGAQSLAEAMQQGDGEGQGDGPGTRAGRQAGGNNPGDPLGRPLRSHDAADDLSVKIPGEIDVQRVRRILEELRRRLADPQRPQIELDYIERLLKDY